MLDNNCKEHEIAGTVIGHQEPWLARIPAVSGYPKQNDEYVGSLGRQRWAGVSQVKIICSVETVPVSVWLRNMARYKISCQIDKVLTPRLLKHQLRVI